MEGKQEHGNLIPPQPPYPPPNGKVDEGPLGIWVMGTPVVPPQARPANQQQQGASASIAVDYIPSAAGSATTIRPIYKNYSSPAPPFSGLSSSSYGGQVPALDSSNPYLHASPVPGSSGKSPMEMLLKILGRCGRKIEDTTRKSGTVAGNVWNHLKTSPSLTDAAMARLAQGTKVLAEGGHDKVFQQTFSSFPGEQLRKAYACYLSTSTGPVIGTIYVSTTRLAFCSDNPLCRNVAPGLEEWTYYKVVVPLNQLKAVNPSLDRRNPAEKYIQIITSDDHEFWLMGFVSYDKAFKNLTEALQHHTVYHPQIPRN